MMAGTPSLCSVRDGALDHAGASRGLIIQSPMREVPAFRSAEDPTVSQRSDSDDHHPEPDSDAYGQAPAPWPSPVSPETPPGGTLRGLRTRLLPTHERGGPGPAGREELKVTATRGRSAGCSAGGSGTRPSSPPPAPPALPAQRHPVRHLRTQGTLRHAHLSSACRCWAALTKPSAPSRCPHKHCPHLPRLFPERSPMPVPHPTLQP